MRIRQGLVTSFYYKRFVFGQPENHLEVSAVLHLNSYLQLSGEMWINLATYSYGDPNADRPAGTFWTRPGHRTMYEKVTDKSSVNVNVAAILSDSKATFFNDGIQPLCDTMDNYQYNLCPKFGDMPNFPGQNRFQVFLKPRKSKNSSMETLIVCTRYQPWKKEPWKKGSPRAIDLHQVFKIPY